VGYSVGLFCNPQSVKRDLLSVKRDLVYCHGTTIECDYRFTRSMIFFTRQAWRVSIYRAPAQGPLFPRPPLPPPYSSHHLINISTDGAEQDEQNKFDNNIGGPPSFL